MVLFVLAWLHFWLCWLVINVRKCFCAAVKVNFSRQTAVQSVHWCIYCTHFPADPCILYCAVYAGLNDDALSVSFNYVPLSCLLT